MSRKYDLAKKAVDDLFNDTTVTPAETKESLGVLIQEIEILIDCLEDAGG